MDHIGGYPMQSQHLSPPIGATLEAPGFLAYSVREAAARLGVSVSTLRRWTDEGAVRCYRSPGGHRRYGRAELESFIDRAYR